MKRILVITTIAAMLLTLVGCKTTGDEPVDVEYVGMGLSNPMHSSTQEEITVLDGVTLSIPKASTTATWTRIYSSEEHVLDQVTFDYGAVSYCYRAQKTIELQDISGMYYSWSQVDDFEDAKVYTNEQGQGIVLWFSEGVSYSISMTERATVEGLKAMHNLVWEGEML